MRKNILKLLSVVLCGTMVLSFVPIEVNAKKPLTTVEKALTGTGVGMGAVIVGMGLWFFNKKIHENDLIPYDDKIYPAFNGSAIHQHDCFKKCDSRLQDIVRCLIFWSQHRDEAFEAALNLYAMNTCNAEWYGSVVPVHSYSVDGITVDDECCLKANWELYCKNPNAPYWLRTHPIDTVPFENICLVLGAKYHISLHKPGVEDYEITKRQFSAFCAVAQVLLNVFDGNVMLNSESAAEYDIILTAQVPVLREPNADGGQDDTVTGDVPLLCDNKVESVVFQSFEARAEKMRKYWESFCLCFHEYVDRSSSDKDFNDSDV